MLFFPFSCSPRPSQSCLSRFGQQIMEGTRRPQSVPTILTETVVIHSCVIFAYIISRRDGKNNGVLAGVSLPPSLFACPSRFPRAPNPLSLPFQTPTTQAMWTMIRSSHVDYRGAYIQLLIKEWLLAFYSYCLVSVQRK